MTCNSDCSCGDCGPGDLPVNPYEALRVSYGMLLGADDFRALIGNPRGKQMLHSAWLHGSGVVWGFDVCLDTPTVRVSPGLAIDGLGRELASEKTQCIDLRRWLKTYDHPGNQDGCERRTVHACVVAEFGCQLSRPVPTLASPCDLTRQHDDFSRVLETASISLRTRDCASPPRPYHRVRVLLGLDEVGPDDPAGREGMEARDAVSQAPAGERAGLMLRQFRRLAALDCTQLQPAAEPGGTDLTYFPVTEPDAAVRLACVTLDLKDADGCTTIEDVHADASCRTALLPTATIQELVGALGAAGADDPVAPDAGGPRVLADGAVWSPDERRCSLPVTAALNPGSLRRAIRITSLSQRGWVDEAIDTVRYQADTQEIVIELADRPMNPLVRVVVRGTGSTPVYGEDPAVPLAGLQGQSPPGNPVDGHDAVLTFPNRPPENGEGR
jgi:hypothetical protein